MPNAECCYRGSCTGPVVTAFGAEAVCLEHFCSRCYEFLDDIDHRQQLSGSKSALTAEETILANECARKALEVCLTAGKLENLERARLLDILLWCGDIASSFRNKNQALAEPSARRLREPRNSEGQNSERALPF